jgi:hypothetical protein
MEERADLAPGLVNGRDDQMRGRLLRQLDDAFPEVRVDDVEAARLEVAVQSALLREHRLALDHPPGAPGGEHLGDDPTQRGRIARPVHVRASSAGTLLELQQQLVEVIERVGFYRCGLISEGFPVRNFSGCGIATTPEIPDRGIVLRQLTSGGEVGEGASIERGRHPRAPFARISARWIARGP